MKKAWIYFTIAVWGVLGHGELKAQGIHFSQYYHAPMLLNPANTGLMPENDYRVGANYRNQWGSIPVPYRTMSAYGDFQLLHSTESNSWMGIGAAIFNDKAGDGDLSLNRFVGFAAYHLALGHSSMISAGLSGAYTQRSVDFSKLSFDVQWDGFTFNRDLPNNELPGTAKTNYFDVGAGLNYAFFPNEAVYVKFGVGVSNINQPSESFYGKDNRLGLRPSANLDGFFRMTERFIFNPSAYYSQQKEAYEMVFGMMFQYWLGGRGNEATQLLLGPYHRLGESLIPAFGIEIGTIRVVSSYDFTVSDIKDYNRSRGAFEISIRYLGDYTWRGGGAPKNLFSCPRF